MSVPFRQDVFGGSAVVTVQCAFNANLNASPGTWTWTDVTADVMTAPGINGTWGRADETSQSTPASLTFSLLNLSGNYSAYTTTGIFGMFASKATPVRMFRTLAAGAVLEYQGRSVGFTPTWDTTGKLPIVQVVAAGTLRRLGQPKTPAYSPAWRAVERLTDGIAHWPMEETSGPVAANTKSQLNPLVIKRGVPTWGTATPPIGAKGAIALGTTGCLTTTSSFSGATSWQFGIGFQATSSATGAAGELMRISMSGGFTIYVGISDLNSGAFTTHGVYVLLKSSDNVTVVEGLVWADGVNAMDGNWHYLVCSFQPDGVGFDAFIWIDGVNVGGNSFATPALTMGDARNISVGFSDSSFVTQVNLASLNVTELYLDASAVDNHVGLAIAGWIGELAHTRMGRVAGEENMTITITGTSNVPMGPQPIDFPLAIYRDCEKSDGGSLFDGFSDGLTYVCRSARYNEAPFFSLDAGVSSQVAPPWAPIDDDQRTVNTFTASRTGGVSYTFADVISPLGVPTIGAYPQSDSFNVATDPWTQGIAGWRVNLGTVNGLRYPQIVIKFINSNAALKAPQWQNLQASNLKLGFRSDIVNLATSAKQHPPGTLIVIVEGYSVKSDPFTWEATLNCVSFEPWRGWTILDSALGRIDASSTTAFAGFTSAALVFTITSPAALAWTQSAVFPADFPCDININGEQITINTCAAPVSIGGGLVTQIVTATARAVNGVVLAHNTGEKISLWRPGKVML